MRRSNTIVNIKNDWIPAAAERKESSGPLSHTMCVTMYKGKRCIGQDHFVRPCIAVGSSREADVVLKKGDIAAVHAYVYVEDEQLFIFGPPSQNAIRVNDRVVKAALLGPQDMVKIGPYRLTFELQPNDMPEPQAKKASSKKNNGRNGSGRNGQKFGLASISRNLTSTGVVRSENPAARDHETGADQADIPFQIVFKGEFKNGQEPLKVVKRLKKKFNLQAQQTAVLLSGKPITIKKGLSLKDADQFKKAFEQTGAICDLEAMLDADPVQINPVNGNGQDHPQFKGLPLTESADRTSSAALKHAAASRVEDDDDEEDDDVEADFSLKEKLCMFSGFDRRMRRQMPVPFKDIGIFKFRKNSVVDVQFIRAKGSFFIHLDRKRFRLARKSRSGKNFFYFDQRFAGIVRDKANGIVPLSDLQVKENLYRRRKGLYRLIVPDAGEIVVSDGCYDYLIRGLTPSQSPPVPTSAKSKKMSWKYLGYSLGVHVAALLILAVASFFSGGPFEKEEPRFVTVDQSQLARVMQRPKRAVKPRPKKVAAVKPAKPRKVVQNKTVAPKPQPQPAPRVAAKKSPQRRAPAPSRHPKAGGGKAKGNVTNRNVDQVGILSMLGEPSGAAKKPSIASITNLDAVKSTNAGNANFKVGGIKGKLGSAKVSVPTSEVVSTRGNSQVLRSAGIGGRGTVAALEKGSVGQKKVMGMVKARLNKSVRIQGGMSREAVKRVIEQHLDEVTYCYESALVSNPSIKGRIIYEWKIRMSGAVGEVRIKSSSVNSNDLHACIKSAIKTWQFPKPVGNEVVVSYPFVFDIVGF